MDLALFDFDGTVTANDNFTMFVRFASSRRRLIAGSILLFPVLAGYALGFISASRTRRIVSYAAFRGRKEEALLDAGRRYAAGVIPRYLRADVMKRIEWHRERGDRIAVVSASLGVYLRPWCESLGLDCICTELGMRSGIATGRYAEGDCTGLRKAERVKGKYFDRAYGTVYAYGDTKEDRDLLELAQRRFFRGKELV